MENHAMAIASFTFTVETIQCGKLINSDLIKYYKINNIFKSQVCAIYRS